MDQPAASTPLSIVARLRIDAELVALSRKRASLVPGAPMYAFNVARVASRIVQLLRQRGADLDGKKRENGAFAADGPADVPAEARVPTARLYEFDPNRKHGERKKDNTAAMDLLRQIDAGEVAAGDLTDQQKSLLAKYSGTGGNLIGADGKAGSAYEYYTPKPIAEGMWDMLAELGFKGGKVLDPCAGVGIFGATAPANVAMESVELNETSGRINQLVNAGPAYNAIVSPFEAVASRTPDGIYDAVISNVPFGGVHDRGSNRKIDPKYQDQPLETYFILRSLEKLRHGGLACFIVPPRVVSAKGGREEQLRIAASYMAEFMGAYRLPNSVFGTADADDTITDVIVLRKFSREATQKIEELREQKPGALIAANVLWQEFVEGRYFQGEGRRFVLGEFVAKDPTKFRDVDRVVSDQSIPNIAKLLRKFPGSRIDWKAIEAAETEPIFYNEGDSMTLAGQTLEMRNGAWVAVGKAPEDDAFDALGPLLSTPLAAVSSRVSWESAVDYLGYMRGRSMDMKMPVWLRLAIGDVVKADEGERARLWNALIAGLATVEVMAAHAGEPQFNYLEEFAVLSDMLVETSQTAQKAPAAFSRDSKAALNKARVVYDRKSGFVPLWRGEGAAAIEVGALDTEAQIGALHYTVGTSIEVDALKKVYGEQFDVMADEGWCLNAAGTHATKADDYYVGNYADFLRRIDGEIAQAEGVLRDKLLRQRAAAEERIEKVDPHALRFNLFSPFVTIEEKAEFMRRFMHPSFVVSVNNLGEPYIIYDGPSGKNASVEENLMSRMASYLSGNAAGKGVRSLSLQGKELGMSDRDALKLLRDYATRLNTQFDGWVKANPTITARLESSANDPERLYFSEVDDNSRLDIPGMNPDLALHGYQNAYVRKQARSFGGINGFDVGLGKAQELNAKILTPDGWKRMGDMKVGDLVFAVDGTAVPVTGVYPQGEKEIFEVEFSDGAKTRCCDEHLWFTQTINDRHRSWRRGGGEVFPGAVRALSEIRGSLFKAGGKKNHTIPLVEPVQHPAKELPIEPYLLGVLLGDGCVARRGVRFCSDDEEIVSRVRGIVTALGGRVARYTEGSGSQYGIAFSDSGTMANPISAAITKLGLRGAVSDTKFVPDEYLTASIEQRLGLLQGLMDTDGTVCESGARVVFSSTSRALSDAVVALTRSLGGVAYLTPKKGGTYTNGGEKKTGKPSFRVALVLPDGINPFFLQRKASRVKQTGKHMSRQFVAVRPVGVAPAQCIRIDHPSRLYVTDDYIVTHNTFTALACTQYVQSIGVKRKTVFVVPNSVLSNWRREAARAFVSTDDCLFIGLETDKNGKARVNPSNYARDFTRVMENQHRKIFCTLEAFTLLPMKDETIEAYETYLGNVDASFEGSERKADDERAKSKLADVTSTTGVKSSAFPFFEDLGIDSLVADEGHMFKNSKDTLEFSGAKFLSVAEASQRGRDMQMKAWFVRGLTPAGDGVLPLTATPITNSPLEIYSMLTLAVGEKKVHDLCMGVKGADEFMDAMCIIEDDEDVGIDGTVKSYRIFRGLQNVNLLRNAIGSVATIKTAADVKTGGDDLKLPESPESAMDVKLPNDTLSRLNEYKMAYRAAKDAVGMAAKDAPPPTPEEIAAFERVQARFGEDAELIAHPFNLIMKMTALIADPELDERATFYTILAAQRPVAEGVVAAFNKLGKVEQRARGGPWTDADAVVGQTTVKDGGGESIMLKIKVRAKFAPDGRIVIDSTDYNLQAEFEKLADKAGLDLDCTIPPKLAALLANVKEEEANPRSASGRVKQLVFCDILPLHNKIKRILAQHAGIAPSAIEIVSGQSIKNPEQMQGIQDGFNADGPDNRYRVVIANEKAEVGINLQKGTQAIHHLTIGWTPDSQHQRNGRGVRQGNTTARVNIYHYDANGTFDEYKRTLTRAKADWIGAVMDKQGGNEVEVSGGLSSDQYDELIESMGDAAAIHAIQDRAALREKLQRAESARQRQLIALQTAQSQQAFLKSFPTINHWLANQAGAAFDLQDQIETMRERKTSKMKPATLIKFEGRIAELEASLKGLVEELDDAIVFPGGSTFAHKLANPNSYMGKTKQREYLVRDIHYQRDIKSEGAAIDEWKSQVDQARAMADESLKEFARVGAAGGGSYSARMTEAFKVGSGRIIDGKPYCGGMFVRLPTGVLLCVADDVKSTFRFPQTGMTLVDALKSGTVIGFESPDYDAAVTEAAAFDDAQVGVTEYNRERLYSAMNSDVAARRKTETLVGYRGSEKTLPSPLFPYPVNTEHVEAMSDALKMVAAGQTSIVRGWENGYFKAPSTATMGEVDYGKRTERVIKAMMTYARANGVKFTLADVSIVLYMTPSRTDSIMVNVKPVTAIPESAKLRIAAAKTGEELDAVGKALVDEALDWLVVSEPLTLPEVASAASYSVTSAYHTRVRQIAEDNRRIAEQIAAANAPAAPADATPAAVEEAAAPAPAPEVSAAGTVNGVAVSGAGKVGLTGETMSRVVINGKSQAVKDWIKAASEEAGTRAKWRGDQLQWDVTPQAWNILCDKYPDAAKLVNVVPAVE